MKKLLLSLLAALVFMGSAEAATQTHGILTLDVPDGWRVQKDKDVVGFWAPDNSAGLVTVQYRVEGTTLKDVAEYLARDVGSNPPVDIGNNWYQLAFRNQHAGDCYMYVTGNEHSGSYFSMTVPVHLTTHPQIDAMVGSIKLTYP